jgi:Activator of Hsp90 ATPase homolog 1-like protein
LGFREDIDFVGGDGYRLVQLTPPGSACSIIFGKGITSARPGSIDRLVMAVHDIGAARDELRSRCVEVSVFHDAGGGLGGGFYAGTEAARPGSRSPTAFLRLVCLMRMTITLADADGGTDLCAVHDGLPSGLSPVDNETGWRMARDKLAALLASEGHER